MKPAFEHTPQRPWESLHCEVIKGASYSATWHFHPEVQLTLVLKSHGYRLVGDNISPLHPGDLVLVGPNLPHVWYQEHAEASGGPGVHAIVVRFLTSFLGQPFLEIPEMESIKRLLERASRGLQVRGATRNQVAKLMQELAEKKGLSRVAVLLVILDLLAQSRTLKPLASSGFAIDASGEDQQRLRNVISYINDHLDEEIDRGSVARQAHLNETAFSRFFKLRTGKTLPQYVNEVRVGRACRLLAEDNVKVIDIALQCGFRNLANFNRRFLQITGLRPREYRAKLARTV